MDSDQSHYAWKEGLYGTGRCYNEAGGLIEKLSGVEVSVSQIKQAKHEKTLPKNYFKNNVGRMDYKEYSQSGVGMIGSE